MKSGKLANLLSKHVAITIDDGEPLISSYPLKRAGYRFDGTAVWYCNGYCFTTDEVARVEDNHIYMRY